MITHHRHSALHRYVATAAFFGGWLAAAAPLARASPSDDPRVDRILSQFDNEPGLRETQVAAIRYYNVSPDQIRLMRTRARAKAILPGISAGLANNTANNHRALDDIIFRARGIAQLEDQTSDYFGWNISASWSLDRLLFNAEELDVMSLIGIQDGIQREVTTLYYIRRRLQIEQILNPPQSLDAKLSNQLRLDELTGLLDAYTGGFFKRSIRPRTTKVDLEVPPPSR
jgi:hypothetical protein